MSLEACLCTHLQSPGTGALHPDEVNSLCGAAEALSGLSGPRSLLQEVMWLRDILKNKALSQAVVMDLS